MQAFLYPRRHTPDQSLLFCFFKCEFSFPCEGAVPQHTAAVAVEFLCWPPDAAPTQPAALGGWNHLHSSKAIASVQKCSSPARCNSSERALCQWCHLRHKGRMKMQRTVWSVVWYYSRSTQSYLWWLWYCCIRDRVYCTVKHHIPAETTHQLFQVLTA